MLVLFTSATKILIALITATQQAQFLPWEKAVQRLVKSNFGHGMSFVQLVDRIIRLFINDEGCCVSDVAQALDLPFRTLQYRLKRHNFSYQKLYDSARLNLAKH
jgi:DNA-binding NtrC family response regulator